MTFDDWSYLGSDLAELTLSCLPLRSIVCAGAVCKTWRSVVTQSSFSARVSDAKKPWFFICSKNNIFSKNNQAFVFNPKVDEWTCLPTTSWGKTPPLCFSRCNPLVCVFADGGRPKFIVVGRVRFIGGLVDIEDRLAVEIFDPAEGAWELCPPLPTKFQLGNSLQWLSSTKRWGTTLVSLISFFIKKKKHNKD